MERLRFAVSVTRGKLKVGNRRRLEQAVAHMPDGDYEMTLGKKHAKPSDPQRAWYFAQIVPLCAAECGYSKDTMHEILKARHLPKDAAERKENGVLVGELVIGGSITKLNKGEMAEYCEEIRQWANGFLGLQIPEPDPNWRQNTEAA
jgi:hypothetical protein